MDVNNSSLLLILIFLPFLASVVAVMMPTYARNQEAWLSGIVALISVTITLYLGWTVYHGEVPEFKLVWIEALGLNFHLRMDGFSFLFAFLITGIGGLVVIYARYYMDPADPVPRFFSFFLAFMGSMLGLVLSDNLIQMVVFWEMTSLVSFMLIAYWHHRADARRGARVSFTITAMGGLCLLASCLLIGHVTGTYEISELLKLGNIIRDSDYYVPILLLFIIACLTKSAQFPFQFWLPNAMSAPTPVSSYLHSATLVKVGVFALAKFWPILGGTDLWFWIVTMSGGISMVIGAYIAMFQHDMKGILAYSTISHLGIITLLLGLNYEIALVAAVFHMINHATFKASLFMATGIVDHETGTRDTRVLSGLRRLLPVTATLACISAAAMAGIPLLNGFLSKEMFFSATLFENSDLDLIHTLPMYSVPIFALIASIFSVAYSYRFITEVFFGPVNRDLPKEVHKPPIWMLLPSGVLVCVCLIVGMLPAYSVGPILTMAVNSILSEHVPDFDLAIWHGVNTPLLMSLIALGVGILVARLQRRSSRLRHPKHAPLLGRLNGRLIFNSVIDGIDRLANWVQSVTYSTRLQVQLLLIVVISFAVALGPLLLRYPITLPRLKDIDPGFLILWLIGSCCAIGAAYQARLNRFRSLIMLGGTGLTTIITFAWLSAPDLALTQAVVEVVMVILILLGLRWLPSRKLSPDARKPAARIVRIVHVLLAVITGAGMTLLSYFLMMREPGPSIGDFFTENALPLGHGHNVVNVILVDFRGFDTFGEILVLGIAGLTVYALLRRFRPPANMVENLDKRKAFLTPDIRLIQSGRTLPDGTMRVPNILGRLMLSTITLISIYFFLRGHNLPGGGFIGGLIFAIGVMATYIISGIRWVENTSRINPQHLLAAGLLLAAAAGFLPMFQGKPFLTALTLDFSMPILGHIHLSSVILFDLGVFCLVVGSCTYTLVSLAHQSLRFYRQKNADRKTLEDFNFRARVGIRPHKEEE